MPTTSDALAPDNSPRAPVTTQHLFGFDFIDDLDHERTIERLLAPQPDDDRLPLVVTPNVDDLVQLAAPAHAELAAAERRARYVLPDGQPIVLTSKLAGRPLAARLPGSLLFGPLWKKVIEQRRPVVIVASSPSVADGLLAEHPRATAVVPPFFSADDTVQMQAVVDECVEAIDATAAEFVFIGIGFPKQQHIALGVLDHYERLGTTPPLLLLIGGSFNMYLGLVRPAPRWVQRLGVEFLFRFALEPRRLFRRYFITDVKFLPMMVKEIRGIRRGTTEVAS